MRLRGRLALTTLLVAVPLVAGLMWVNVEGQRNAFRDAHADLLRARLDEDERVRCERAPEHWTGRPPGRHGRPQPGFPPPGRPHRPPDGALPPPHLPLFAYGEALDTANPHAPELSGELVRAARRGDDLASRRFEHDGHPIHELFIRTGWGGACAFVLDRRPLPPGAVLFDEPPPLRVVLLPALIVLLIFMVALGPVVRRIRRLADAVRGAARADYQEPIAVRGNDEIAELAHAFNDAGAEVRGHMAVQAAREQALRSFLANTTHDVGIPLTVLQGHLAAIRTQVGAGEPVAAEAVAGAMEEAHYMGSLIHNLDAAAKLQAGEPHYQRDPVDLNHVVERSVARHRPIARQRGVSLDCAVPARSITVVGDITLIQQAFGNVVYNAIRYNQAGGHVAVVLEHDDGRFTVRVIDDGPGIPAAERPRLLERSVRGDEARSRAPTGSGLGLSIACDVAELHGWQLDLAESEFGGLEVSFAGAQST